MFAPIGNFFCSLNLALASWFPGLFFLFVGGAIVWSGRDLWKKYEEIKGQKVGTQSKERFFFVLEVIGGIVSLISLAGLVAAFMVGDVFLKSGVCVGDVEYNVTVTKLDFSAFRDPTQLGESVATRADFDRRIQFPKFFEIDAPDEVARPFFSQTFSPGCEMDAIKTVLPSLLEPGGVLEVWPEGRSSDKKPTEYFLDRHETVTACKDGVVGNVYRLVTTATPPGPGFYVRSNYTASNAFLPLACSGSDKRIPFDVPGVVMLRFELPKHFLFRARLKFAFDAETCSSSLDDSWSLLGGGRQSGRFGAWVSTATDKNTGPYFDAESAIGNGTPSPFPALLSVERSPAGCGVLVSSRQPAPESLSVAIVFKPRSFAVSPETAQAACTAVDRQQKP